MKNEICEMNYSELLEERKDVERRITHKLLSNNKAKVYEIKTGRNNRILSLSPYALNNTTSLTCSRYTRWKYSHLSSRLHTYGDERSETEEQIKEILPFTDNQFIHLVFAEFETYESTKRYCDKYNIPAISKQDYNKMKKLINKWRILSEKLHYKMTKQDKRKLKKLFRKI